MKGVPLIWAHGSASSAYELRGDACAGREINECIEVKAVPGTERVDVKFRDADCGTLSLNSIGQRGPLGTPLRCWP